MNIRATVRRLVLSYMDLVEVVEEEEEEVDDEVAERILSSLDDGGEWDSPALLGPMWLYVVTPEAASFELPLSKGCRVVLSAHRMASLYDCEPVVGEA